MLFSLLGLSERLLATGMSIPRPTMERLKKILNLNYLIFCTAKTGSLFKYFCIFYALTAIPIFGFVNFRMANFIKEQYKKLEKICLGPSPSKRQRTVSDSSPQLFIRFKS